MTHQGPSRRIGSGCSLKISGLGNALCRLKLTGWCLFVCSVSSFVLSAQEVGQGGNKPSNDTVQVIAIQGTNWWIAPSGAADWVLASTRMPQNVRTGDRIRTGRHT